MRWHVGTEAGGCYGREEDVVRGKGMKGMKDVVDENGFRGRI